MAAEISNQLTTSAEVHLTALAGTRSVVPVNNNDEDSCEINGGDGDRIVSVDVPNGDDHDGDFDRFDDLELGAEDGAVPLGDILDKFEAVPAPGDDEPSNNGYVVSQADTAISATVNVSTLDLSDPESIHRHLSKLNDTVLKVSTACIRLNHDNNNENDILNNNSSNGLSSDDLHFQASTSSPSSSSCSLDPQIPPPPQTPAPATPLPSSASSPKPPPPLPQPSLETLPSGTRSIRTFHSIAQHQPTLFQNFVHYSFDDKLFFDSF